MLTTAASKTLSLLLLIVIGFLFRNRIGNKEQREGIRTLILSLALPVTIFIALVKIELVAGLMIVPLLALSFNLLMYGLVKILPVSTLFQLPDGRHRSLMLLIPSLAPGLSAFPFILEFSGEGVLAVAALADLGNKVFVLVIAYWLAMKWHMDRMSASSTPARDRMKSLLRSLIQEPVNLAIIAAILLIAFGIDYAVLPVFIRDSVDKLALLLTPLVLIFIGLSVKLSWSQVRAIFSFLTFRSGIAFALSGLVVAVYPFQNPAFILLAVVIPQSACSFWPYAHMAVVSQMEGSNKGNQTFDLDFAMNVLACSLPFSVMMILAVYSSGDLFTKPSNLSVISVLLITMAILPVLFSFRNARKSQSLGRI
jgi:predicted permease